MTAFDQFLADSTTRDSNIIPGCVVAAMNKEGNIIYSKASGYNGVSADAKPIDLDTTFWIASCTKLIGTIAVLQCVQRGQIGLDETVENILPELANPGIISDATGSPLEIRPAKKKITVRHLLSHTSGLAYDIFSPTLTAWRAERGEALQGLAGDVTTAHRVPLLFEPGEGWVYGGGVDWAGEMIARLNNTTFGDYLQQHVFAPLGLRSLTFQLEKNPVTRECLMKMTERTAEGELTESVKPWPDNAPQDCAGGGLHCSVLEYVKILGDLIKDSPTLLQRKTISKELFTPQFAPHSPSHKGLLSSTAIFSAMTGASGDTKGVNFNIGGLLIEEDTNELKEGTLMWGGYPNLVWFMNQKHGVAGTYATQLIPPGDPKSSILAGQFMQEIWSIQSS